MPGCAIEAKTAPFGLIAGETAGDPGVPPGTALAWLAIALELDAKARLRVASALQPPRASEYPAPRRNSRLKTFDRERISCAC